MATKRKFKRDYIILESKDMNFRYKERVLPKAFAKVEINEEKSVIALYVENLKCVKDGYKVVAIQSDYETLDLGNVVLSEQGKGEFVFNLERNDIEIKGIALLHEKQIPLVGFKGNKIDNYEEILFAGQDEYEEIDDLEDRGYEDIYIDNEEDEYEYEEIEYIEIDDEDDSEYEYEEIEYIEIDDEPQYNRGYTSTGEEVENDAYNYEEVEETEEDKKEYTKVQEEQKTVSQQQDKYLKYKEKQRLNQKRYMNSEKKDRAQAHSSKTAGNLLMPRQIKKGLRQFKEVIPFTGEEIENTRWWKIDITPTTLCGYTMPYLGYVNSLNFTMYSDAIMQSYKYRHYLFGVQYDEYNKRQNYIYAVPGKKDEQPDQGHTGFSVYQPCDYRNNNLGYWLCYIDSRSRQILK